MLDSISDAFEAFRRLFDVFHRFRRRAVAVTISINGKRSIGMPTQIPDDRRADAKVQFSDRFGDQTGEPATVQWSVDNAALASVTPNASDDTSAVVEILAGAGTFHVTATSGNLTGTSDDLVITPGAAAAGTISITLEPATPPTPPTPQAP